MGEVGFASPTASRSPSASPNPVTVQGMKVWARMLRRAVSLGIGPEVFWRLSWREWRMLNEAPQADVMGRAALEAMMARFPDAKKGKPPHHHAPENGARSPSPPLRGREV